jgi:hypothetical protein
MKFEKLLTIIKDEKVEPYEFTKNDGVLLEDEEFQEWSNALSFLGNGLISIAMVNSENMENYEAIYEFIIANRDSFQLVYDNGESTMYGFEYNGIKVLAAIGPVCCLFVGADNKGLFNA